MCQYKIFRLFNNNYKQHIELARQILQGDDMYNTESVLAIPYLYNNSSKNKLSVLNDELSQMIFSNEFFCNAIKTFVENGLSIQRISLIEGDEDNDEFQETVDIMTMKLRSPSADKSNLNDLLNELEWLSKEEDIDIASIDFKVLDNAILKTITIEKMGHILIPDKKLLKILIDLIEKSL